MDTQDRKSNKTGIVLAVITGIIIPIFCVFLTHFLTNRAAQANTVTDLSEDFDVVDENMSYDQALQAITNKYNQLKDENAQLDTENIELQNQISKTPKIEFFNPAVISDGLKIQESASKAVALIDGNIYYFESALNQLLSDHVTYDSAENVIFYNTTEQNIETETKIDLFDTNVLYDGTCYGIFMPSEGNSFSMGSKTYNKGFVIYDDHSLFGQGDGYALFDLQGKYSKISFDVGRTNEYEKQDVSLKVYLDNEYVEEYSLNAESPPITLEINLNYANSLKLEITGGSRVKYGFANVILHY